MAVVFELKERGDSVMKNAVIFGASKNGYRLKKQLEKLGVYEISFFCDNNERKVGNTLDGIDILSFEDVLDRYQTGFEGDFLISVIELDSIVDQIRESGLKVDVYGATREFLFKKDIVATSVRDVLYKIDTEKPRLSYFEYHISYHCNLRCKGCGHFSNVVPEEYGDFENYKKDIHRLKELFWGVGRLRLMGGEPLLNKNISDFISITREVFPDANIRVVTNGLLLPYVDKKVLELMNKCYVAFDITQYPPTEKLKEKIELRCIENEVEYSISPLIQQFFDNENMRGDSDKKENFDICVSKGCHFLENGKISVCASPILRSKYKEELHIDREIANEDIIDIYDKNIDGFVINELLSQPMDACRYCDNVNIKWFDWTGNYTHLGN